VFGRLDRDASKAQAQAELQAIGHRAAIGRPGTPEHLRAQLIPYAWLFSDPSGLQVGLALGNTFVVMLLVLVSANVALLMFARAATREMEIAVRSALGASRARIVGQTLRRRARPRGSGGRRRVVRGARRGTVTPRDVRGGRWTDAAILGGRPPDADHRDLCRRADDSERGHH
jgi:hypothetical protein